MKTSLPSFKATIHLYASTSVDFRDLLKLIEPHISARSGCNDTSTLEAHHDDGSVSLVDYWYEVKNIPLDELEEFDRKTQAPV